MEQNYTTVQARIQRARRERSAALGLLLSTFWSNFPQRLASLFLRPAPGSKPVAQAASSSPFSLYVTEIL